MGGGGVKNRLLFKNYILLFSGTFVRGQGFDGGRQSHDRGDPPVPPPTRENPENLQKSF